jgi:hypothetical protein
LKPDLGLTFLHAEQLTDFLPLGCGGAAIDGEESLKMS